MDDSVLAMHPTNAFAASGNDVVIDPTFLNGYSAQRIRWSSDQAAILKTESRDFWNQPPQDGPYQKSVLAPLMGPRLFVSSGQAGDRFRIQILVGTEMYEAAFQVKKSPTFIGFRALDFVEVGNPMRRLQAWPDQVTRILLFPDGDVKNQETELTIYGRIDLTINPHVENLQGSWIRNMSLPEFLLSGQPEGQSKLAQAIAPADLRIFMRAYQKMVSAENVPYVLKLSEKGEGSLREFLRQYGIDTLPLQFTGHMNMTGYLSQFHSQLFQGFLNIPHEEGLFGKAHGKYSHALQVAALLVGLSPQEGAAVRRVLLRITDPQQPELWFVWHAMFTSFSADGPHSTAWWP